MTLNEAREHIGDGVVYQPDYPGAKAEDGVITGAGTLGEGGFVFVRYAGDLTSKATRPEDLILLAPERKP